MAHVVGQEPLIRMVNIVKEFPGVIANDHVNFELSPGEIHALLGENGAGKTTLMNILYGLYQPNEGEIYIKGRKVKIKNPRDALWLGIGMVHQHFLLVERHTVAENLALGYTRRQVNPLNEIRDKIREFSIKYHLKIDPDSYIWQLSAGEQQKAEIIKALYSGAEILILDEPTSVLTPQESSELFSIIKKMRDEGKGIVFITHKLAEVFAVADKVTVMRKGKVIGTLPMKEASKEKLASMMVGREVVFVIKKKPFKPGKPVLEVRNLVVLGDRGREAVKSVSFTVREGEILGIAGVAGNGQKELIHAIVGLRRIKSGRVRIMSTDATNKSPREIADLGVGHIPEERLKFGIVPDMSVAENSILKSYYKPPYRKGFLIDYSKVRELAEDLIKEYNIAVPTPGTLAKLLSGGNMQKLIVGRELKRRPKLIIASNPTFGLDVGATEYIRKMLLQERDEGAAILLVSSDLDEVMQLSDRVAVMFNGEIVGIVEPEEVTIKEMSLMMSGIRLEEAVK